VRVVQPWAGNGWGWQHLPRIGSEVAVCFMNGDPDYPVVIGGLYNGNQSVPFSLPDQKNVSGLRTRSTTSGGTSDYSELSFDDTAGSEKVLLHAQYDLNVEVEHNETITVQNNRAKKVAQDETVEIDNTQTIKVAQGRSATINAGGDSLKVEGGDHSVEVSTGNIAWKASAGAITGEALQSITLKVGGNSITIDQSGVTISGIMIKISGQAMVQVEGPMTTVSGDGMLTLKGGIMMLN
jgi:type VI secretion system secreted protein VgrG